MLNSNEAPGAPCSGSEFSGPGGGFIRDAFPRTLAQTESIQELMQSEGWTLGTAVNYDLSLPEIVERLSGRRMTVRTAAYERSTAPLIDFYTALGLLVTIAATRTPDEISARTIAAWRSETKDLGSSGSGVCRDKCFFFSDPHDGYPGTS